MVNQNCGVAQSSAHGKTSKLCTIQIRAKSYACADTYLVWLQFRLLKTAFSRCLEKSCYTILFSMWGPERTTWLFILHTKQMPKVEGSSTALLRWSFINNQWRRERLVNPRMIGAPVPYSGGSQTTSQLPATDANNSRKAEWAIFFISGEKTSVAKKVHSKYLPLYLRKWRVRKW